MTDIDKLFRGAKVVWRERAEKAEAEVTRPREALKPFGDAARSARDGEAVVIRYLPAVIWTMLATVVLFGYRVDDPVRQFLAFACAGYLSAYVAFLLGTEEK